MAKIYSTPEHIKVPEFNFKDIAGSKKDEARYIEELRAFCKSQSKSKLAGEVIRIPHADGYAQYMVFSMKPVELIHMNIGDAWDSPMADLLTAKRINEMVESAKRIAELFSKKV